MTLEMHAEWCPSGTSNPAGLPTVGRSVRFRHTSAKAKVQWLVDSGEWLADRCLFLATNHSPRVTIHVDHEPEEA